MKGKSITTQQPPGITLLLVVLVLSLVSSIAVAVTMLIIRQFEQGADVRSSVVAQNTADSGVERILYRVKSARTGLPSTFVQALATDFGCSTSGGVTIGDATFCTDEEQSFETEDEVVASLDENETVTIDMYDPESDPLNPSDEITAIEIEGAADPGTWLEVTWAAWDASTGEFSPIASTTKEFFDASEIEQPTPRRVYMKKKELAGPPTKDIYFLNDPLGVGDCTVDVDDEIGCYCTTSDAVTHPECSELDPGKTSHINYIVRIRPLFGTVQELRVRTMKDCLMVDNCAGGSMVPIPARISVKVIGEYNSLQQAVKISVPWRFATAGLFDYVLLAEEDLTKLVTITPGFQSTGTVEAETGTSFTTEALPNFLPETPYDCDLDFETVGDPFRSYCQVWNVVKNDTGLNPEVYTGYVRCQKESGIDASNGGTCGFDTENYIGGAIPDDQPPRITYDLANYDLGEDDGTGTIRQKRYYLNARFRVTSEFENESINVGTCRKSDGLCGTTGLYGSGSLVPWFDEAQSPGLPNYSDNPYYHKNKDGWVLCSKSFYLTNDYYLQFRANDNFKTEASPRLDWWNISTIPFNDKPGSCEYVDDWDYDETEFTFDVEDSLSPENNADDVWCCQNWFDQINGEDPGTVCSGSGQPRLCTEYSSSGMSLKITDWLGLTGGSTHMLCSDRDIYYPGGGVTIDPHYDATNGCSIQTYSNNKIGYAIPVEEFLSPEELGEGSYYITMRIYEASPGAQIAIRPTYSINDLGVNVPGYCAVPAACTRAEYAEYLEDLVDRSSSIDPRLGSEYDPKFVTTVYQGYSNWAPEHVCYINQPYRVKAGDAIIVLVESGSSGSEFLSVDDIQLTQDEPIGLPEC